MFKDNAFIANEFGFAIGPRYSLNYLKDFFIDIKFGLGYETGRDYAGQDYSRFDFIIEPDIGYNLVIRNFFTISFGLGVQTLLCIFETPSRTDIWDWGPLGRLSHYYLPVANVALGLVF